jgi:hypothetical protein
MALAAMVQPDVRAPMDRRVNHPPTPVLTQMASTAFVVLMHVDMSLAGPAALKVLQAQDRRRSSAANLRPSLNPPSMIASMSAWDTDWQRRSVTLEQRLWALFER